MTNKQKLANLVQGKPIPDADPFLTLDQLTTPEYIVASKLLRERIVSGGKYFADGEFAEIIQTAKKRVANTNSTKTTNDEK